MPDLKPAGSISTDRLMERADRLSLSIERMKMRIVRDKANSRTVAMLTEGLKMREAEMAYLALKIKGMLDA